uniref:Uncharacterized protein n=1 Tax=viral metagenome TaxID=1070528 RepID=A0A6M3JMX1_9ZZZZ
MRKETFIRLIELMQDLTEKQTSFNKIAKAAFNDSTQIYIYDYVIDKIYDILKKEYPYDDWVGWWIWENDYGKGKLTANYKNGKKINLKTAEDLWRFLENYTETT